jgi:hypothetical protein
MQFTVRLYVQPAQTPDLDQFYRERREGLRRISETLRRLEPVYDDQELIFRGIDYSEIALIDGTCKNLKIQHETVIRPAYAPEEINAARWVPLLIKGNEVDADKSWKSFNRNWQIVCSGCGYPEFEAVPEPYLIRKPKHLTGLWLLGAANGMIIMSADLWDAMRSELEPWLSFGSVAFESNPEPVSSHFLWIRPREEIGAYTDHMVKRVCESCKRPVEIRGHFETHPIVSNLIVVDRFFSTEAPIARVGNWFGELRLGYPPSLSWDVVVSGAMHAKFRELNVKGFHPSEQIVHCKSEIANLLK